MPFLFSADNDLLVQLARFQQEHPGRISAFIGRGGGQCIRLADVPDEPYAELFSEIHWTKRGAEYIRNEEFRYISPEMDLDYISEKSGNHVDAAMLAIGLTNRPFINGMAPVELKEGQTESDIQILMTGTWYHLWYGKFTVTIKDLTDMVAGHDEVFRSANSDSDHSNTEMMVDYNHGSLAYGPENAIAAGWVRGKQLFIQTPDKAPAVEASIARIIESTASSRFSTTEAQKLAAYIKKDLASSSAPNHSNPSQGAKAMNDELIRKLLSLGADVEITEEHRSQALKKVHEENVQLLKAQEDDRITVRGPDGADIQLTEAELPGRVILTQKEYDALAALRVKVPAEGSIVLKKEDFDSLKANADAGAQAAKKLRENEVETAINDAMGKGLVKGKEVEGLKKLAEKDMELFLENLANRSPVLKMGESGTDEGDPDTDVSEVKKFMVDREAELKKLDMKPLAAYSQALKEAQEKFPADAIEAWRHPVK